MLTSLLAWKFMISKGVLLSHFRLEYCTLTLYDRSWRYNTKLYNI